MMEYKDLCDLSQPGYQPDDRKPVKFYDVIGISFILWKKIIGQRGLKSYP